MKDQNILITPFGELVSEKTLMYADFIPNLQENIRLWRLPMLPQYTSVVVGMAILEVKSMYTEGLYDYFLVLMQLNPVNVGPEDDFVLYQGEALPILRRYFMACELNQAIIEAFETLESLYMTLEATK